MLVYKVMLTNFFLPAETPLEYTAFKDVLRYIFSSLDESFYNSGEWSQKNLVLEIEQDKKNHVVVCSDEHFSPDSCWEDYDRFLKKIEHAINSNKERGNEEGITLVVNGDFFSIYENLHPNLSDVMSYHTRTFLSSAPEQLEHFVDLFFKRMYEESNGMINLINQINIWLQDGEIKELIYITGNHEGNYLHGMGKSAEKNFLKLFSADVQNKIKTGYHRVVINKKISISHGNHQVPQASELITKRLWGFVFPLPQWLNEYFLKWHKECEEKLDKDEPLTWFEKNYIYGLSETDHNPLVYEAKNGNGYLYNIYGHLHQVAQRKLRKFKLKNNEGKIISPNIKNYKKQSAKRFYFNDGDNNNFIIIENGVPTIYTVKIDGKIEIANLEEQLVEP